LFGDQSANIDRRLAEHVRGLRLPEFDSIKDVRRWNVDGGKTAREAMEQSVIDEPGGLTTMKPDGTPLFWNRINPIGVGRHGRVGVPRSIGPT